MSDMTDIRNTILGAMNLTEASLSGQYKGYVDAVADALEAREDEIKQRAIGVAHSFGLSANDIDRILVEVFGTPMAEVPVPEPAPTTPGDPVQEALDDLTTQARDLIARLQALIEGR